MRSICYYSLLLLALSAVAREHKITSSPSLSSSCRRRRRHVVVTSSSSCRHASPSHFVIAVVVDVVSAVLIGITAVAAGHPPAGGSSFSSPSSSCASSSSWQRSPPPQSISHTSVVRCGSSFGGRHCNSHAVFSPVDRAAAPPPMTAAVEAYLEERKSKHIQWHTVLNNNASTRPKELGGPLVRSITACKTFSGSSASGEWECALDLPNSFAIGDGLAVQTSGTGASKQEASEVACLRAVARLISANPSAFVLRPTHWTVSPDELLTHLPGAHAGHQPLPVHIPARASASGEEAATPDAEARIVALLCECLDAHGGEFDPSRICHKRMPRRPDEERAYSSFNKLLLPGSMKAFIESHPEFAWRPKWGATGMLITWADGQVAQAAPPIPADGGGTARRGVQSWKR